MSETDVVDESILASLTDLARGREAELHQFRSLAGAHQYLELYRWFRRTVPAGASVLDWGAGNGHFSYFLSRAGYRTTGYSIHGFDFESWLGDPGYHAVHGSPEEPSALPFETGAFDAVASIGVLEHVRETGGDEIASLREIARVLKPGGHFLCYHFPNRYSAIDFMVSLFPSKYHHPYRYTANSIADLVAAASMDLVEVSRYGVLPRNSSHRLLGPLARHRAAARAWDALDRGLNRVFSPLAQNYRFIARARTPSPTR